MILKRASHSSRSHGELVFAFSMTALRESAFSWSVSLVVVGISEVVLCEVREKEPLVRVLVMEIADDVEFLSKTAGNVQRC